jgi:hypothetical protein
MGKNIFFGLILITTRAFFSGSFAIPLGKTKGWGWDSNWLMFNISAYIISPLIACLIFVPEFENIYKPILSRDVLDAGRTLNDLPGDSCNS